MRIIHVVPTYFPAVRYGGPIFAVHGLCAALAARGHDVQVFTTSIDGPANSDVAHGVPVTLDGVTIRYFESKVLRRLSWAPALAHSLRQQIRGADLVHLQSVFLWPTAAAARLARQAQIPYVISPRGMLVGDLIARRHSLIKRLWISLIERRNLEAAAAIHVTSLTETQDLASLGLALRRVEAIPNGIADIESEPTPSPPQDLARLAAMQPLVLFFGRISWKKGLQRIIEALARTATAKLAIVGTDDEGLAPALTRAAAELGVADRVHIVPRTVTGAEKEYTFKMAKALILASLSENFGNVILEAMQRGVPVITIPAVGAAELVSASHGGIVVDDDVDQLAGAIEKITGDPSLGTRLGKDGQDYACSNCRWTVIAAQMEAFYSSLVDQSRRARVS